MDGGEARLGEVEVDEAPVVVAALLSFAASLVCFTVDARRIEAAEAALPFPSMLR